MCSVKYNGRPRSAVSDMTADDHLIGNGVGDRRLPAWLLGTFALVALLLYMCGCLRIASYSGWCAVKRRSAYDRLSEPAASS